MKLLKIFEKAAALLAVFFLPSQLALHFWPSYSFVFGIRIDYLSPAIYFTDLLIILLIIFCAINCKEIILRFIGKHAIYFSVLLIFILLNTLFSSDAVVTLYKWSKILEYIFFGIYIFLRKDFLGERNILKAYLSSAVLISLIGILQFFLRQTTGLFYFLGERSFYWGTPGIALVSIAGKSFLRAYSILPHPNSLAGFLGISIIFFLFSPVLKKKTIWYISLLILLFGFCLTFSLSAYIAFGILLIVLIFRKTIIFNPRLLSYFLFLACVASLILPIYSERILKNISLPENISQRMELTYISGKMAGEDFITGKGLNTFIINSINYRGTSYFEWLMQPVHNIFLLTLTETGMIGLLLSNYSVYIAIRKFEMYKNYLMMAIVFFVLFTGLSDHYWFTIQQNSLLLAFIFGLHFNVNER